MAAFGVFLAPLGLGSCHSFDGSPAPEDATDAGLAPSDAGLAPSDAGLAPTDAGLAPPDAGCTIDFVEPVTRNAVDGGSWESGSASSGVCSAQNVKDPGDGKFAKLEFNDGSKRRGCVAVRFTAKLASVSVRARTTGPAPASCGGNACKISCDDDWPFEVYAADGSVSSGTPNVRVKLLATLKATNGSFDTFTEQLNPTDDFTWAIVCRAADPERTGPDLAVAGVSATCR